MALEISFDSETFRMKFCAKICVNKERNSVNYVCIAFAQYRNGKVTLAVK